MFGFFFFFGRNECEVHSLHQPSHWRVHHRLDKYGNSYYLPPGKGRGWRFWLCPDKIDLIPASPKALSLMITLPLIGSWLAVSVLQSSLNSVGDPSPSKLCDPPQKKQTFHPALPQVINNDLSLKKDCKSAYSCPLYMRLTQCLYITCSSFL